MSSHMVAEGHDVALLSLTVLDPQPDPGEGLQFTSIIRAADGTLITEGPFHDFKWSQMEYADYAIILALFGVDAAANSAEVTIYIRNETYANWRRYNGIAQKPIPDDTVHWDVRPQDITIRVTDLVLAT